MQTAIFPPAHTASRVGDVLPGEGRDLPSWTSPGVSSFVGSVALSASVCRFRRRRELLTPLGRLLGFVPGIVQVDDPLQCFGYSINGLLPAPAPSGI